MSDDTVTYSGVSRRILTYPEGTDNKPICIMLHPYSTTVDKMAILVGVSKFTGSGFNLVLPQALPDSSGLVRWDDSPIPSKSRGIPDTGFIQFTIERALLELNTAGPVFIAGYSNGGYMVHRFLHEDGGEDIAGAATVCTLLMNRYTEDETRWGVVGPMPMMIFNGTSDTRVPYNGQTVLGAKVQLSTAETAAYYAEINDFDGAPTSLRLPNTNIFDRTRTVRLTYGSSNVVIYKIENGGHTWPGSNFNPKSLGRTSKDIDASELMVSTWTALI